MLVIGAEVKEVVMRVEATVVAAGEAPTWAPNSRNLIFTRRGVNKRQLAIVDVPTKQVKILPAFVGSASQPAWGN